MRLFTVGHSNRSLAEFLALLDTHSIDLVADVRSYPGSKRYPQFDRLQRDGYTRLYVDGKQTALIDPEVRPVHLVVDRIAVKGKARLAEACSRIGVGCIDVRAAMQAAASRSDEAFYYYADRHLTPEGHRVFAALVEEQLRPLLPDAGAGAGGAD